MKRLRLNGPLVLAMLLLAGLLLLLVLPWLAEVRDPHLAQLLVFMDGILQLPPFEPGEFGYLLGTDIVGRDLFARLVYGARTTVGLALVINLIRACLAIPLGLLAGWRGGWFGRLVQALATGFGAIPTLVITAISLSGLRTLIPAPGAWRLAYIAVVVVMGLPRVAEHVRRRTEAIALLPHVEAAESLGATDGRILWRHVLPVMRPDLLVMLASEMAWVLLLMGQLAVFGIFVGGTVAVIREGLPTKYVEWTTEWGQMLGANRQQFLSAPWIPFYPGLALGLAAAAFHFLAEGLRVRSLRR